MSTPQPPQPSRRTKHGLERGAGGGLHLLAELGQQDFLALPRDAPLPVKVGVALLQLRQVCGPAPPRALAAAAGRAPRQRGQVRGRRRAGARIGRCAVALLVGVRRVAPLGRQRPAGQALAVRRGEAACRRAGGHKPATAAGHAASSLDCGCSALQSSMPLQSTPAHLSARLVCFMAQLLLLAVLPSALAAPRGVQAPAAAAAEASAAVDVWGFPAGRLADRRLPADNARAARRLGAAGRRGLRGTCGWSPRGGAHVSGCLLRGEAWAGRAPGRQVPTVEVRGKAGLHLGPGCHRLACVD